MRVLKIAGAAIVAVIVVIALLLMIKNPSGFLTSAIQDRVKARDRLQARSEWREQIRRLAVADLTFNDLPPVRDPKARPTPTAA